MKISMRAKRYERNFAVIELLVAIAIISILAALLFPSPYESKAGERHFACAGGLQQIEHDAESYADGKSVCLPSCPANDCMTFYMDAASPADKQNVIMTPLATIDFKKVKKLEHVWEEAICSGVALVVTRRDLQEHLKMAHEDCGFKYLRFHWIFSDYLESCTKDKDGKIVHNWQNIDYIYSSVLKAGMKPLIEMSFMPTCLAKDKKYSNPPGDVKEWGRKTTSGCMKRRHAR